MDRWSPEEIRKLIVIMIMGYIFYSAFSIRTETGEPLGDAASGLLGAIAMKLIDYLIDKK